MVIQSGKDIKIHLSTIWLNVKAWGQRIIIDKARLKGYPLDFELSLQGFREKRKVCSLSGGR
jgi:hypothetical protein